ncbi:MAG: drug/metabolite transporter (DMT)-like permease [Desulforhopalus sp.]|jgi:drug/metabolite transporter (DMT)-like permease
MLIVCIWSGWITISRYGVHSSLQPADITLLRYTTALIFVSPLILRHRWSKFSIYQYLLVGLGIGFPYTMASFYGLQELKAAHAGVLVNGMLPIFGAIAAWFILSQSVSRVRYIGIGIVFLANFVMAGGDTFSTAHIGGIVLLLSAAIFYTIHMVCLKLWHFEWKDVLVTVPVVNTLLFLPCLFIFPTNLLEAEAVDILSQSFYQGIMVNIIALMCATYAIKHLGTITVSIYMSIVPVTTALLAWIILGETLNNYELAGIAGCSIGLFIYSQSQVIEARRHSLK